MSAYWRRLLTRREVFGRMASGLGGAALASLLPQASGAETDVYDAKPKPPHFPPKARAVIQLFMHGGPSQMDLFDPKPKLNEFHGKPPVESLEVASPQAAGN